ncbi:S1 family peptidase [Nocardia sp. NPDC052316]|uniref:S1 family peptidase n=1 Tax=Nocardia sp. NPDC052316 TaxID=3364329 RepID=UPI0037CC65EC
MHLPRRGAAALVAALLTLGLPAAPASAIVGGAPTEASDYPWLAAVGSPLFLTRPSGQFCGGALIAPDQLVTAAHCVALARQVPQALTVTFGRTELRESTGVTVRVKDVRIHPDFHDSDFDGETVHHNDLAILTLDRPQPGPVLEVAVPQSDSGTILGWGATSEADDSNTHLRTATVPLVPDAECAAAYGAAFDPRDMLCAGSTAADTGQYDSGGPLLVDGRLVGLTSWGKGAARPGFPGVYTKLSAVLF